MSYEVKILADSQSEHARLTTFELTFPRFILAEFNTHRMLSRNSASSRAIPTEILIQQVLNNPFLPEFNERVKGMGVGKPLSLDDQERAEWAWLDSRNAAVDAAQKLLHVDKSRANRLLEPFLWHKAIVSATEWENFFALRCHSDTQPEFQHIAKMMRDALGTSTPEFLSPGEWHLPLISSEELGNYPAEELAKASAGRCARVSYDRHNTEDTVENSVARWEQLCKAGHWSPGEHPAAATHSYVWRGNFAAFCQLRKMYANENVFRP